jgi:hypothetical protein
MIEQQDFAASQAELEAEAKNPLTDTAKFLGTLKAFVQMFSVYIPCALVIVLLIHFGIL